MIALLALAMAAATVAEPVKWLDEDRVLVTTVVAKPKSPMSNAEALMALSDMAKRACKPIGRAVSEGTVNLDKATDKKGREVMTVSEVYLCVPK